MPPKNGNVGEGKEDPVESVSIRVLDMSDNPMNENTGLGWVNNFAKQVYQSRPCANRR